MSASAQEFKVMTYNIRGMGHTDFFSNEINWEIRKYGVFRVIEEANPDIFALQEDLLEQAKDVQSHFLPDYQRVDIVGSTGCEAAAVDEFVCEAGQSAHGKTGQAYGSIFFRASEFEALDQGEFIHQLENEGHFVMSDRYAKWVKLRHKKSNREFYVSNVHLHHQGNRHIDLRKYTAHIAAQERSVGRIARAMWSMVGDTPYISLGDMNNFSNSNTIKYLTSEKDEINLVIDPVGPGIGGGDTIVDPNGPSIDYHANHKKLQFNFKDLIFNFLLDNGIQNMPFEFTTISDEYVDHILTSSEFLPPFDFERFNRHFKDSSFRAPCNIAGIKDPNGTTDRDLRRSYCRESDHFALMATVRFRSNANSSRYYDYLKRASAEPKNLLTGSYFNDLYGFSNDSSLNYSLGNGWNVVPSGAQLTASIDDSGNTGTQSAPAGHPSHLHLDVQPGLGDINAYLGINQEIESGFLELKKKGFARVSFYSKTNINKTLKIYYHLGTLNSLGDIDEVVSTMPFALTGQWTKYDSCFEVPASVKGSSATKLRFSIGYQHQQQSDLENDLTIDNIELIPSDSCS